VKFQLAMAATMGASAVWHSHPERPWVCVAFIALACGFTFSAGLRAAP
jgi:hypothetical protein